MTLIEEKVFAPNTYRRVWLADDESEITANFDRESAPSSMIVVISTKSKYIKNSKGQWQKSGTAEVIV